MDAERFLDRRDAGRVLAARLARYAGRDDAVVLGLARGGVPVAYEVARALDVPLDVLTVRKLGVPGREEVAMGAIATGDVRVLNAEIVATSRVDADELAAVTVRERAELARRERTYRAGRPPRDVAGRTAIVVDDGLATGATMLAAIRAVRRRGARTIVAAVPVGAPDVCARVGARADVVVCARTPVPLTAVGRWYEDFAQTTDDELRRLLVAAQPADEP